MEEHPIFFLFFTTVHLVFLVVAAVSCHWYQAHAYKDCGSFRSQTNVLSLHCFGARSTATWLALSYFHVGLAFFFSLCPEQEGPGGVGVCVCVFVRDCWQAETRYPHAIFV